MRSLAERIANMEEDEARHVIIDCAKLRYIIEEQGKDISEHNVEDDK